MIDPESISEKLLYSTVKIETNLGSGTGFFFRFAYDEATHIPAIVTNKHVIGSSDVCEFYLHKSTTVDGIAKPSADSFQVVVHDAQRLWIHHPDPTVDLCAMPVQPLFVGAQKEGNTAYHISIDESIIPTEKQLQELSAIEDVVMVGYPIGLWDHVNNFPLLRRGITSTHPAIDYCGKSETVIDAACFPGSSGSPVFVLNEGGYSTRHAYAIGNRLLFLGVLYGAPIWTASGEVTVRLSRHKRSQSLCV